MDVQLPTRILSLTAALALALPSITPGARLSRAGALDAETAVELARASDVRLESQRGGSLEPVASLSAAERAALEQAERASSGLEEQRGGDVHFTDREIKIILWTAAVIAVVLLIA